MNKKGKKFKPTQGIPAAPTGIPTVTLGADGSKTVEYLSPRKVKPTPEATPSAPPLPSLLSSLQASADALANGLPAASRTTADPTDGDSGPHLPGYLDTEEVPASSQDEHKRTNNTKVSCSESRQEGNSEALYAASACHHRQLRHSMGAKAA